MHKIAFCGKAGSGKTALSSYLAETYGFKKMSFADAVKEIAYKYFGMRKKDRRLLQQIGQKMRAIDKNVWVNILVNKLEYGQHLNIVIDDVRFLNEAKALKDKDFIIIKLIGRKWDMEPEQMQDISETELEEIIPNYTLDTSKPIEETIKELEKIVKT